MGKLLFGLLFLISKINAEDIIGKVAHTLGTEFDSLQVELIYNEAMLEAVYWRKENHLGYPAENHTVRTGDGFILTMHRMPYGKENGSSTKRQPILLVHGIMSSSQCFIDSRESSLACYLADHGYDVWLGNLRGNMYTHHEVYPRKDKKFWNFSWEEMAEFDIAAMIDYILEKTEFEKIPYIGHSMGTTVGFALFSTNQQYAKKISGFVALSSVASLRYATTLVKFAASHYEIIGNILTTTQVYSFPNVNPRLFKLQAKLCPTKNPILCTLILDFPEGFSFSSNVRNNSRDFLYLYHIASSDTSIKTIRHFTQTVFKNGMYKFDYGLIRNHQIYHASSPPKYPLHKMEIPIVLFHSANDAYANPIDVKLLSREFPNLVGVELIGPPLMNHVDILYAIDAKNIFQDRMLEYLNNF